MNEEINELFESVKKNKYQQYGANKIEHIYNSIEYKNSTAYR